MKSPSPQAPYLAYLYWSTHTAKSENREVKPPPPPPPNEVWPLIIWNAHALTALQSSYGTIWL